MSEGGEARNHEDWRDAAEEVIARFTSGTLLPSQRRALIALGDAVRRSPKGEDHEVDREISKNAPLRERIADELAHNDECGPGPVSWQEYLADADAILRIVGERSPQGEDHETGMVGRPDCEDCGIAQALRADLVALRSRASASERDTEKLQRAIDVAFRAMNSSAYVGGPTEREAWQTALAALGEVVTQHKGQGDVLAGESSTTEE